MSNYINEGKEYLQSAINKLEDLHKWSDTKGYMPDNEIPKILTDHAIFVSTSAASLACFLLTGELHPENVLIPVMGLGGDAGKNKVIDFYDKRTYKQ